MLLLLAGVVLVVVVVLVGKWIRGGSRLEVLKFRGLWAQVPRFPNIFTKGEELKSFECFRIRDLGFRV